MTRLKSVPTPAREGTGSGRMAQKRASGEPPVPTQSSSRNVPVTACEYAAHRARGPRGAGGGRGLRVGGPAPHRD